jgi:hypothetical protein
MRGTGVWTYGVVNLVHILAVAALFGSVLILDLRLIVVWRRVSLSSISQPAVPVAAAGFSIAALTGLGLLATKATEYSGNPFFYIKFPAIALGLCNVLVLARVRAWREHRARDLTADEEGIFKVFGAISLVCWTTAITAGRMIGYW